MKPLTRKEFFMAKAAGQSVPDLEPITREEYFLNQIAESGGGSGLPTIEEGDEGKVLTVDDGEAVWAEGGGGSSDPYAGYDLVWKFDTPSINSIQENQMHLVKGSFESAGAKAAQRLPVTALAYYANNASFNDAIVTTFRTEHVHYDEYVPPDSDPYIEFRFYNTKDSQSLLFWYYPDGTISID